MRRSGMHATKNLPLPAQALQTPSCLTGAKILRLSVLIEHPLWIKNLSGGSNFPATAPSSVVRHERAGLC